MATLPEQFQKGHEHAVVESLPGLMPDAMMMLCANRAASRVSSRGFSILGQTYYGNALDAWD